MGLGVRVRVRAKLSVRTTTTTTRTTTTTTTTTTPGAGRNSPCEKVTARPPYPPGPLGRGVYGEAVQVYPLPASSATGFKRVAALGLMCCLGADGPGSVTLPGWNLSEPGVHRTHRSRTGKPLSLQANRPKYTSAFLRVLAQPSRSLLASLLDGVAAIALLHLAIPPRGLLRVLVEPMEPLCVRLAESAARVLRTQQGRPAKHGEPATDAALDALPEQ
eukprot:scaffold36476_cov46-Phaeocystis_antarctica.AAC.1